MLDQARLRVDPDQVWGNGAADDSGIRWIGVVETATDHGTDGAGTGGGADVTGVGGEAGGKHAAGSPDDIRAALALGALLVVVLVLASAAYFYTVWTGVAVPYQEWLGRMWLHSWI